MNHPYYEEHLDDPGGQELISLAQRRTTSFLRPRVMQISTPTGRDPFFKGAFVNSPNNIMFAGRVLQEAAHGASKDAGWWTHHKTGLDLTQVINNPVDALQELLAGALVAQKLCLTHSEVSEAMEGHRKGLMDDKLPHRTMLEVELADAVIRIADLAGALNLDLGGAIAEKMAFNAQRPDHKPEARQAEGGKAY